MSNEDSHNRWRVLLLDTKRSNPNHYLCLGLQQALRSHPQVETVVSSSLGEALSRAREARCNVFIAFDGEELHRGICARLAALCERSLLWVTEDPYEIALNSENAAIFDLVFTNDSASVGRYGDKGRHLPLAASPNLHFLQVQEDEACLYDLFFAGTAWPNRVALLKQMLARIEGLKTKLVLPHNEHLPPPSRTLSLPESAYSWRMSNAQFVQFANRSRVVLSLHRVFAASPGGSPMAATPGPRLFEVAMAGGFQLVDLSLPETANHFEEGREFVGFTSPADAVEKLEYYLMHPQERLTIARAAQTRAAAHHTYRQRVDCLLSEAASLPQPKPIEVARPRRKRILHVTHNIVGAIPFGGVEIYQDLVARHLVAEGEFEVLFYVPDSTGLSKAVSVMDSQYRVLEKIDFPTLVTQETLTEAGRESAFARVLARYAIDVVHFQHLIGHVPSLPYMARALGIPTMISLHDYYTVCWEINLLNKDGRFCAPETISETTCDICIGTTRGGLPNSQSSRRGFYGRMLAHIDVIHCNTDEVARRYRAVYPQLAKHPALLVRGVPIPDGQPPKSMARELPMRVVVLGNFTLNKGAEFLLQLFSLTQNDPICFDIMGKIDYRIEADVRSRNLPNVIFRGGYAPGEQKAWLKGASVALFASKWPETYCLSLSEAWQAGLVPVAPDLGAFSERIRDGENGFKYAPGQLGDLINLLRLLAHDESLLRDITEHLGPHLYATATEHCLWLSATYRELAARSCTAADVPKYQEREEPLLPDCGVTLTNPSWLRIAGPLSDAGSNYLPGKTMQLPGSPSAIGPYQRATHYFHRYGLVATSRRILYEIRQRARRG
jgi:glycosyltransferase involved in cell wall biosynthesis/spore maturation protein CgeB